MQVAASAEEAANVGEILGHKQPQLPHGALLCLPPDHCASPCLPVVRSMMPAAAGAAPAPSTTAGTAAEKRKLLWAGKKAGAAGGGSDVGMPTVAPAALGANRWDTAELGSDEQKAKFLKLMVSSGILAGATIGYVAALLVPA